MKPAAQVQAPQDQATRRQAPLDVLRGRTLRTQPQPAPSRPRLPAALRPLALPVPGQLTTAHVGTLWLESGESLPNVHIGFETFGTPNVDRSNAVLLLHALTGNSHAAAGQNPDAGWWDGLVGPGKAVDTRNYFVVVPNVLGGCHGSTGPADPAPDGQPWGSRFPYLTLRDTVRAEKRLADQLGITAWHAVVGGSMGGARALEWAATYPERVRHAVVLAACTASSAEQIAWAATQVQAVRLDPHFNGGDYYRAQPPEAGLGLARKIAHVSYRSEADLAAKFGRAAQPGERPVSADRVTAPHRNRYSVESYLDHQAAKLAARFDANSYLVLTEALMSHDVGRGRGGAARALQAAANVRFTIAAVDSDRLYPSEQSEELAAVAPGENRVHMISSRMGHDAFLTEISQLAALLSPVFARV